MVSRSPSHVGAAFRSHNAFREPCRLRVTVASDGGSTETIQLPVTICWWSVFWHSCVHAVFSLLPPGWQNLKGKKKEASHNWKGFFLLLHQEFGWRTATTLSMTPWSSIKGNGTNNSDAGAHARRDVNLFSGNIGCSTTIVWRSHAVSRFRQLFVAGADSHSAAVMRVAQRHLAAGKGPSEQQQRDQVTDGGSRLHMMQAPWAGWYARQVDRCLMDFESLQHLCRETQMRDHQRRVAVVLGCITAKSHHLVPWSAADALALLPTAERAAAVATLISHRVVPRGGLDSAMAVVLTDPHVTHDDVWVLLQALIAVGGGESLLSGCWVREVVRRVVASCNHGDGAVSRERVVVALMLGERVLDFESLSNLCCESGMWYESVAYRSAAERKLLEENPPPAAHSGDGGSNTIKTKRESSRNGNHHGGENNDVGIDVYHYGHFGFGQHMTQLLQALRNGTMAAPSLFAVIETLRRQMPPVVARYTIHRVAAALTRAEWERDDGAPRGITALEYLQLAVPLHGEAMTKCMSKFHFDMGLGTASSAQMLLPLFCRSWSGTVRVMQHTRHAGVHPAMYALRILMELAPLGRYYLLVRLRRGKRDGDGVGGSSCCNLLLEARAEAAVDEEEASAEEDTPFEVAGLWRCLAEVATRQQQLQQGDCPLWKLPVSCVSRMATAMPQLPGSLVSYWIRSLLRHKRHDSVEAVMQTAANRGVLPEMAALVEVLEGASDATQLQRVVHTLRSLFPDCAPAVFRAFVERTSRRVGDVSPHTWDAALHLLSAVSVLGLVHYPQRCMESIAACAPTPVVLAMLQLLNEDGGRTASSCPTPAPLEWSAVCRLIRSAQVAGLRATVDCIAVPPTNKKGGAVWWSSDVVAVTVPLATALYKRQVVGLWYLALQDITRSGVPCRNGVEMHHAIRLASFGTESATTLLRGVMATRLLQHRSQDQYSGMSRRKNRNDDDNIKMMMERGGTVPSRRARVDDVMLVTTLGCAAGALLARGRWESALCIIPLGVSDLPPLLRLAQLKALQCSSDFHEHATMLLESESLYPVGVARRCCSRMPVGLRKLVAKLQMSDAFRWWEEGL